MAWLNFNHAQSNSKNALKAKKIKLPRMKNTTNKIYMYLLASFILQNFKKILRADVPFWGPKWSICPPKGFFGTNHYYYFHLPIGRFHCTKYKKFLLWIQNYENAPFWGPIWSICPKQNFFGEIIDIILIYLLASFIVQNFKNFPADPQLWECAIFGPKMAHFPK